jgi:hypothetical protein
MVEYGNPGAVEWVESEGGPLIVLPEGSVASWGGRHGQDGETDYDRTLTVDGLISLLRFGAETALILGDEPASTAYLPERNTFVRWYCADSEQALLDGVEAAIDSAEWEAGIFWDVTGPVVLFEAAWSGAELDEEDHLRIDLIAGRYSVRAGHVAPDGSTSVGVVELRRQEEGARR